MARRTSSFLGEVIELIAALPWWAGVIVAAGAYEAFHLLALRESVPVEGLRDFSELRDSFIRGLATALQYVVPVACLAGAGLSALTRHRRATAGAQGGPAAALEQIAWPQFEELLGEAFKLQGYAVRRRGQASEGGELELTRGKDKALVRCQHWRAARVPLQAARELYAVMAVNGAAAGFLVTCGDYAEDAKAFAQAHNIELIDGRRLLGMFDDVRQARTVPDRPSAKAPACPKCGATMVRRIAREGRSAGKPFWGCASYPACNGARPL